MRENALAVLVGEVVLGILLPAQAEAAFAVVAAKYKTEVGTGISWFSAKDQSTESNAVARALANCRAEMSKKRVVPQCHVIMSSGKSGQHFAIFHAGGNIAVARGEARDEAITRARAECRKLAECEDAPALIEFDSTPEVTRIDSRTAEIRRTFPLPYDVLDFQELDTRSELDTPSWGNGSAINQDRKDVTPAR